MWCAGIALNGPARGRGAPLAALDSDPPSGLPFLDSGAETSDAMRSTICIFGVLLWAAATIPVAGQEEEPQHETLTEALRDSTASMELRYRYEIVADEAFDLDAHASTLRTVLSFETGLYKGFGLFLEAENVSTLGADLYNNAGAGDLQNGCTDRPVVADPGLSQTNQGGLRYTAGRTTVRVGRQEILLDDQRFVGNVGLAPESPVVRRDPRRVNRLGAHDPQLRVHQRVHDIRGGDTPVASHLMNAALAAHPAAQVVGYAYALDYELTPARSTGHVRSRGLGRCRSRRRRSRALRARVRRPARRRAQSASAPRRVSPRDGRWRVSRRHRDGRMGTGSAAARRPGSSTRRWRRCTRSTGGPTGSL